MIRGYEAYQSVSSRWFNKIPSSWAALRAKWIFSNEKERSSEDDEQLAASQKWGVVPQKLMIERNNANVMLALKGTENFKRVKVNDFVISLRSFEGGIEHSCYDGCISPAYTVLRLRESWCEPRYFKYTLKCKPFIQALNSTSEGIRDGKTITYDEFGELLLALPPQGDQEAIASFLDRETARIDNLIAEKQTFISLLKEKRQALISHVVTKGLDSSVKMKDSGVEWIGEVPEHWAVGALGYYAALNTGATPDRKKSEYWGGDIPWLSTSEVRYKKITESNEHISELGLSNTPTKISPPGTLLMAMYGQGVTRGRVAILGIHAAYNQACVAITPNSKIFNEYLQYFYIAAYNEIRITGNLTSQMNLNADLVGKFKIIVPPVTEQYEIVKFLDDEKKGVDALEQETERSIELLKEHRTALISAAVTGKIDVRSYKEKAA